MRGVAHGPAGFGFLRGLDLSEQQRDRVVDLVGGDVDVESDGLVRRFRVRTQFFRIDIETDDNPACCFATDQNRRRNNREKECFEESARVSRGGQPE